MSKERAPKCNCTLHQKLTGDGCDGCEVCNPRLTIDLLRERIAELEAGKKCTTCIAFGNCYAASLVENTGCGLHEPKGTE